MGFGFRKSFKCGPFKATLSKSGVSVSAGVGGCRVTKKANGNVSTTLSVPGTGLHYTKEKAPNKKEKEQVAMANQAKDPTKFYDLIPFDNLKDKVLFMLGWYATLYNQYEEGVETEENLSKILETTFKISDVNEINKKVFDDEPIVKNYTSNHLSTMIEKGWFIRESRGNYKINSDKIYPYIKQFPVG